MKRILYLVLIAIVAYSIYYDLTTGTLPAFSAPIQLQEEIKEQTEQTIPYIEVLVQAGDTVLSIIEREEGHLTKPIDAIMKDFEKLNNGISPHEIQIGKIYKFPTYLKPTQ